MIQLDMVRSRLLAATSRSKNLILDGEILVMDQKSGRPLPFGTLAVHKFKALEVCL